jgi:7-cyano-7-deazaguanine synthase
MKTVVVLLSGGLDSSTLLHRVAARRGARGVHALSVRYGQTHARELRMAAWQAREAGVASHRTVDLRFYGDLTAGASALTGARGEVPALRDLAPGTLRQPITYVPNRNMTLISIAAAYAESLGAREVYYGAQAQDRYGYWDCTREFVSSINRVLALNRGKPVRVVAPFVAMTKAKIVKIGLELGVDYGHTWTCYRGGRKPCGECPSCVERADAFRHVGVPDPLQGRGAGGMRAAANGRVEPDHESAAVGSEGAVRRPARGRAAGDRRGV